MDSPNLFPNRFDQAMQAHQAGRLDAAEAGYREVLQRDPSHGDALHLLGVIQLQRGKAELAEALMRQALDLIPQFPALRNNLGMALEGLGRREEAESCYRHAIALEPGYGDAWYNLGNILTALERHDEAKAAYLRARQFKPEASEVAGNLGLLLDKMGDLPQAEACYREAIRLNPDNTNPRLNLAHLLGGAKQFQEASAHYQTILEREPDNASALNGMGNALLGLKRMQEAEVYYQRALVFSPDDPNIRNNHAGMLHKQRRLDEAEREYALALSLAPQNATIRNNYAMCLRDMARFIEAEAEQRQVTVIDPDFAEGHINLGYLYQQLGRFKEAETCYLHALELKPGDPVGRLNLALMRLAQGRFSEAWDDFESRLDDSHELWSIRPPECDFPAWRGEPLAGKSIVIWHEQGLGDEIIFCRFAQVLKQAGAAWVSLVCKPLLKGLMGTLEGPDVILSDGDRLDHHDYWVFPMTLPARLGMTMASIPARIPYLYALPAWIEAWKPRLPSTGLKVGLVWRGEPRQPNNTTRSLDSLGQLAPLWRVPGITFISLQKGEGEAEALNPPPDQPLLHLGGDLRDFTDTAGIVAQLDLIITICTATAHLAGAMGKPCWVLTPAMNTFWLWFLERTDSPWYPGVVRLFRQTRPLDWSETLEQIAQALEEWAAERAGGDGSVR